MYPQMFYYIIYCQSWPQSFKVPYSENPVDLKDDEVLSVFDTVNAYFDGIEEEKTEREN